MIKIKIRKMIINKLFKKKYYHPSVKVTEIYETEKVDFSEPVSLAYFIID